RKLIWQPLEEKLAGAATILVSPDGVLDRFPFAALPGKEEGTYLIEDVAIATIPIPRSLPELISKSVDTRSVNNSLLSVGNVNFDIGLPARTLSKETMLTPSAPRQRDSQGGKFSLLPGTIAEIKSINDTFTQRFPTGRLRCLEQDQATK